MSRIRWICFFAILVTDLGCQNSVEDKTATEESSTENAGIGGVTTQGGDGESAGIEATTANDPSAAACSLETNHCTGCNEDSDCDGIDRLGVCDDGRCVECTDSETHCFGSTPICHENKCRVYKSHAECDFAGEVCNSETGACYQSDDVIYVDRNNCDTGADGSQERPFCQVGQALNSIHNLNTTRIPILVRAGIYSSFMAVGENRTRIIGMPGASVLGSRENPAIWVRHDSDTIIEGLRVLVLEGQKGIECKGEQGENPTLVLRDISVNLSDGEYAVRSISNCDLTLEDSELFGIGDISRGVFLDACSASSKIKIARNSIDGFGTNVAASKSLNTIRIEDNVISNGNTGVYVVMGPGRLILNRNRITGAKTIAVQLFNSYSDPMAHFEVDANIISFNGLGLQMLVGGTFQVTNNIIARNGELEGEQEEEIDTVRGGVYVTTYQNNVENIFHSNTVVYNQSSDSESACGGVCSNDNNPLIVENSIVYGNTPSNLSNDVQTYYSIVGDNSGNQSDVSNPDNVHVPEFVSPDGNDFHLSPDSPGVDRGGSRTASHQPNSDSDGDPRFQGEGLDIGADEVR